ncbi:hypothetical protein C2W62_43505 [Candidatus Entotheonella serta]|nr:hypothetical protein C2W62_43505 [Candidatus Entotheonella serta]
MAFLDGKPAGRIAGIVARPAIEKWGKRQLRFGWFDFIDDTDVSKSLLGTVESWGKELEMEAVHGPLGFTSLDSKGMLIEGFEEPRTLGALYNYAYYPQHMVQHGYDKDVDWVEYEITLPEDIPEKVDRISRIVEKRLNLKLLRVNNAKGLLSYAKELFEVLEESYRSL